MMHLPEIPMTIELSEEWERLYLDFVSGIYITACRNKQLPIGNDQWFLQEIAYGLCMNYPDKSMEELGKLLTHITDLAKTSNKS